MGVPALLVPMPRQTDDQAARAREAERAGLALAASGAGDPELEARLDELLEPERNAELRAGLDGQAGWRGAEQAAAWIERGVEERRRLPSGAPRRGAGARPYGCDARGSSPRACRGRSPGMPRSACELRLRVLITAFGLARGRFEAEQTKPLAEAGEPAEGLLVVTDRLEFAALCAQAPPSSMSRPSASASRSSPADRTGGFGPPGSPHPGAPAAAQAADRARLAR